MALTLTQAAAAASELAATRGDDGKLDVGLAFGGGGGGSSVGAAATTTTEGKGAREPQGAPPLPPASITEGASAV